jgi:hypothetical protein
VTIRVTDNGYPPMSATRAFNINVLESNLPPVIAAVPDQVVNAGGTLVLTNSATDPDVPTNVLSFALDLAPAGASINPNTGLMTWTAPSANVLATNAARVRVTDNGVPNLSATNSFNLISVPPPRITGLQAQGSGLTLTWNAFPGKVYRIQAKDQLTDPAWVDVTSLITSADLTISFTNNPGSNSQRFFRVQQTN